jgi:hypothetical protein
VNRLQQIQQRLTPLKAALLNHPIYQEIDRVDSLRLFMEHHVFAVWDFMSLLKALQRRLCCIEIPWLPATDPLSSRLINEIVLAEESDEDGRGGFASHFQMYHQAMIRCGANTAAIDGLLGELREGKPVAVALESPGIPESARRFVRRTFQVIDGGNICASGWGTNGSKAPLRHRTLLTENGCTTPGSTAREDLVHSAANWLASGD